MGSSYTPTLNKRHDFPLGFARCKPDFFLAVNRGNLSPLHFLGKNASFLLYSFVKYNIFMGSSYTPTLNKRHDFSLGFAQCKPDFFLAVNRENLSPLHFLWQECILLTIFLCKIQYFLWVALIPRRQTSVMIFSQVLHNVNRIFSSRQSRTFIITIRD